MAALISSTLLEHAVTAEKVKHTTDCSHTALCPKGQMHISATFPCAGAKDRELLQMRHLCFQ
jgi:hypothetical protein